MIQAINKISDLFHNKTIRNGGLFTLYAFINKAIGFILLIILAKYIGPSEYGLLNLYNTIVMFLGFFIDLSSRGYFGISFFRSDRENFKKDFTAICIISIILLSFFSVIVLLFHKTFSALSGFDTKLLYIAIISAFCSIFIEINLNYARIQEQLSKYGILSCSYAIISMGLTLFFVIGLNLSWQGRVYGLLTGEVLFLVIAIISFIKNKLFLLPKDFTRYKTILLYGIPLIPHMASNWLRQGCDRFIINSSYDTAAVGIFSFALNLTSIIFMIGQAFNATNSVDIYKTLSSDLDNDSKIRLLRKKEKLVTSVYMISLLAIVIGAFIFIPIVMPQYVKSLPYFAILSIYGFLQCMYFLYCNYLFYYKKTHKLMYITFGMSALHLLLSLLLTRYSLYLTSIIYIISFGAIVFFVKRQARLLFPLITNEEK